MFIQTTIDSKFVLAPRGYGRSSFRFFEILQLGSIPIYVWNDINWLPFKEVIDYTKLCIVIHVSELHSLKNMIEAIDETRYNKMIEYYEKIKHLFELDGMSKHIVNFYLK